MALNRKNINTLLSTIIIFIVYLFYTQVLSKILGLMSINDSVTQMFISDLIFLLGIIVFYKKKIKSSFNIFVKNYKLSKKIIVVLKWVVVIFFINILMGAITEFLFPEVASVMDDNSEAIYNLFSVSSIYTIFKTMIFAVVAEELVFKQAIRDVFTNNIVFIAVSSLIYVIMNFAYADFNQSGILIDMLGYLMFAIVTSIAYIKNDDNIFIVMLIKFFYSLVPLLILVLGLGL